MSNPLAGIADVTDVVKNTVIAHPSDDDDVSVSRIMGCCSLMPILRVVLLTTPP